MTSSGSYTCEDYRKEMMLIGLLRRLKREDMADAERRHLIEDIGRLKASMEMDEPDV